MGIPCADAQADGIPCTELGKECADCERYVVENESAARKSTTEQTTMREVRIHGRGGQGAVIASKLLAAALFRDGQSVQSFPAFGVERRGAPVTAFLRSSSGKILLRCEITEPDDLIVLDPTLVEAVNVAVGLKPGGSILINSPKPPEAYPELAERYRVATVDANTIARKHGLGSRTQPIVNTAILGAFAVQSGLVRLDSVCDAIAEEIPIQPEENVAAAREAAEALCWTPAKEVENV
jgi:2-oxoacid:acceptor oxidoreductase gamma subunit (pyruvate/2-ketoisovalerate family)